MMKKLLISAMSGAGAELSELQAGQFIKYYELLVEWNEKMNLTAITEPKEVFEKHFADSAIAAGLLGENSRVIDVGTGAGFPGVPLLILRPDIRLTLLDSLNKRLGFLKEVCSELGLAAEFVHARAEDGGRDSGLRGAFDHAVSRAVAPLPVLIELTTPFLKVGGTSICYKGPALTDEVNSSRRALFELTSKIKESRGFHLPWGERRLAIIEKTDKTKKQYPRKAGTPSKQPL